MFVEFCFLNVKLFKLWGLLRISWKYGREWYLSILRKEVVNYFKFLSLRLLRQAEENHEYISLVGAEWFLYTPEVMAQLAGNSYCIPLAKDKWKELGEKGWKHYEFV